MLLWYFQTLIIKGVYNNWRVYKWACMQCILSFAAIYQGRLLCIVVIKRSSKQYNNNDSCDTYYYEGPTRYIYPYIRSEESWDTAEVLLISAITGPTSRWHRSLVPAVKATELFALWLLLPFVYSTMPVQYKSTFHRYYSGAVLKCDTGPNYDRLQGFTLPTSNGVSQ